MVQWIIPTLALATTMMALIRSARLRAWVFEIFVHPKVGSEIVSGHDGVQVHRTTTK